MTSLQRLWTGDEDGAALGLCRIAIASVLLMSLLSHVGAVGDYFSANAALSGEHARAAFPSRWSLFFLVEAPWFVTSVFAAGVAAHIGWILGWQTRLCGFVSWGTWVSLVGRNPLLYSLPDQLQMALCALLAFMPCGNALSLDARRRGERPVPVWCRRLLQLQLAVMYVSTAALKHGDTWWRDGTALYYALVNPYNRHFDIGAWLAVIQPYVLRPMTWITLAWEWFFGLGVAWLWVVESRQFARRWDPRLYFLVPGVLVHLGIQVGLYVVWFTWLVFAAYLAFVRPEEVRRGLGWWARRRSGLAS